MHGQYTGVVGVLIFRPLGAGLWHNKLRRAAISMSASYFKEAVTSHKLVLVSCTTAKRVHLEHCLDLTLCKHMA